MEENKNIIEEMKNQHKNLFDLIEEALVISKNGDDTKIDKVLKKSDEFKAVLDDHLKLENNIFYDNLIQRMEAKGEDTNDLRIFIDGMDNIEKAINEFFERFKGKYELEGRVTNFHDEFVIIKEQLRVRVEAEENLVYPYWDKF